MPQQDLSLRTLPLSFKVLATCFLLTMGIGYLFGVTYLYLTAVQAVERLGGCLRGNLHQSLLSAWRVIPHSRDR